ncbi:hypothetical protein Ddye_005383 [Dipteronia dyeriana]|uniref:HAT C-terminal dimerisation domain-containing protein n=1 Tax=Dipteronia dyeriana TaxID=168575 RepID=A0AAD9XGB5_9ROSI|nr:hypothetical protein Ddye_005383 [Dipteronia dyeriana]
MSEVLNTYREDEHLSAAVVAMETKLKKYWANIPLLYALSVIVDHMIKLSGLEVLLEFICINLSIDYLEQITDIRTKLFEIFRIYESRFGNIDTPQSTQPETELKQTSWSLLKRRKKDKSTSTSSGQRFGLSSCTELIRYLEAHFNAVEDREEFYLLLWWKTYTYRYPVLSHLARDVLVIPVSTVSSEQAFSTSGLIIEPRRSCLSPEMVETRQAHRAWPVGLGLPDRHGTTRLRQTGVPCWASVLGNGTAQAMPNRLGQSSFTALFSWTHEFLLRWPHASTPYSLFGVALMSCQAIFCPAYSLIQF